jgi:hypothetical protein
MYDLPDFLGFDVCGRHRIGIPQWMRAVTHPGDGVFPSCRLAAG